MHYQHQQRFHKQTQRSMSSSELHAKQLLNIYDSFGTPNLYSCPWSSPEEKTQSGLDTETSTRYYCPFHWAKESHMYACEYAYKGYAIQGGTVGSYQPVFLTVRKSEGIHPAYYLGVDYYDTAKNIINEQLTRAGVRLAKTLDQLLKKKEPKEKLLSYSGKKAVHTEVHTQRNA